MDNNSLLFMLCIESGYGGDFSQAVWGPFSTSQKAVDYAAFKCKNEHTGKVENADQITVYSVMVDHPDQTPNVHSGYVEDGVVTWLHTDGGVITAPEW